MRVGVFQVTSGFALSFSRPGVTSLEVPSSKGRKVLLTHRVILPRMRDPGKVIQENGDFLPLRVNFQYYFSSPIIMTYKGFRESCYALPGVSVACFREGVTTTFWGNRNAFSGYFRGSHNLFQEFLKHMRRVFGRWPQGLPGYPQPGVKEGVSPELAVSVFVCICDQFLGLLAACFRIRKRLTLPSPFREPSYVGSTRSGSGEYLQKALGGGRKLLNFLLIPGHFWGFSPIFWLLERV